MTQGDANFYFYLECYESCPVHHEELRIQQQSHVDVKDPAGTPKIY